MTIPILLTLLAALGAFALALLPFAADSRRRGAYGPSATRSIAAGFFGVVIGALLVFSASEAEGAPADDSKNDIVIGEDFDAPSLESSQDDAEKPQRIEPSQKPKQLSVNPGEFAPKDMFPEDRPEWVNNLAKRVDGVDLVVVNSGPHYRPQECQHHLDRELKRAVDEYIDDYLNKPKASLLVNYDLNTIKQRLISHEPADQYGGEVNTTVGEFHEEVRLLKFDQQFRNEVDAHWTQVVAKSRLLSVGLLGGGVFGLLLVLFGFLKVDNATRGYYTGRLQFASITMILIMIVVGVMIARWIPWM